jgi:hypothetical protein
VNDTWVSFTWYPTATDPGVSLNNIVGQTDKFSKYVGTVSHFDVWAYGTNFFNLDFLQSQGGGHDPIQGIFTPNANGAVEVYGFARSTLGFNEILGTKMFSTYFTKDISFEWGGDANTENNFLAPEKKDIVLGAQFTLNVPGTVNLAVLAYKEWNHNTFWASEQITQNGGQPGIFTFNGAGFNGDRDFQWIPRIGLITTCPAAKPGMFVFADALPGQSYEIGADHSRARPGQHAHDGEAQSAACIGLRLRQGLPRTGRTNPRKRAWNPIESRRHGKGRENGGRSRQTFNKYMQQRGFLSSILFRYVA